MAGAKKWAGLVVLLFVGLACSFSATTAAAAAAEAGAATAPRGGEGKAAGGAWSCGEAEQRGVALVWGGSVGDKFGVGANVMDWARDRITSGDVLVVGFLVPGLNVEEFSYMAGAFAESEEEASKETSWPGVSQAMLGHPSAVVLGGQGAVNERLVDAKEWVQAAQVEDAIASGRRGVLVARFDNLDVSLDGDARMVDGVVAQVWERARELTNGRASVFVASPADSCGAGASAASSSSSSSSAVKRRRLQSTTVTTQYVTMVPEVFTGIILFLAGTVLLVVVFCCCLDRIEGATAFAKQYPAKGKVFE